MKTVPLSEIARYCDRILDVAEFEDWPGAVNGLQVENRRGVSRIAAAVDASLATVKLAIEQEASLLLVHHGLFWGPSHPWTGKRHELLRVLIDNDLAVYSSHLPLDAHPKFGNNAVLSRALGFKKLSPFFMEKGRPIGWKTTLTLDRDAMAARLEKVLGVPPKVLPGGPVTCRKIGIVTGGAGGQLDAAAKEGVDTFITGEGPHWSFANAEHLGINVFYGGHYATETFGVKALASHLARKFGLSWIFLDHPTGL